MLLKWHRIFIIQQMTCILLSYLALKEEQSFAAQCNDYLVERGIKFVIAIKRTTSLLYFCDEHRIYLFIQYYFRTPNLFPSMQQGSQLHLALLRKISQLMPTPNFRERFNQSRKRRDFFRCNITEQSNELEMNHSILPLCEHNVNHATIQKSEKKIRNKKYFREENITISAWSIDEKDQIQQLQDTRYQSKLKEMAKVEAEPTKKRNLSFHANLSLKKHLPQLEYIRSPSQDYSSKLRMERQAPVRCKFNKIKHINLNLDKENELNALEHLLLKEAKIRSVEKISSYNAFVTEMKMQERNKKLRH